MFLMKLLALWTILTMGFLLTEANYKYKKLINKLNRKLDPDVMPLGRNNEAVNVSMGVSLIDITEANVHKNEIEIEAWLDFSWNSGITWPSDKYDLSQVKVKEDFVWKPDMTTFNGHRRFDNQAPPLVVLHHDGKVTWFIKTRIDAKCQMSPKRIARNQTCVYKIGSWTSSGNEIHLQEPEGTVDLSMFESPKYKLLNASLSRNVKYYACCPEPYETFWLTVSFVKKDRKARPTG